MLPGATFLHRAFVAALLAGALAACAEDVNVAGNATGDVKGVPQLTFDGHAFAVTTSNGIGSFTGSNSLGSFSLASGSPVTQSGIFVLRLNLEEPTAGGRPAYLRGIVSPSSSGGVVIHFIQPAAKTIFGAGGVQGSLTITLSDVSLQPGQSAPLVAVLAGSQQSGACQLNFTAARAAPAILPEADGKMVPVLIKTLATDNPGCGLRCRIDSVSSNDGGGDWQTTGDLGLSVWVDRQNSGNGRLYTVAVECSDNAGNSVARKTAVVEAGS
ncbi:MAG: hypothetical protein ACRD3S_02695, partial [Terracidiphilus sp.]